MFLSMLVGVRNVAPLVLSASVAGYVVLGLLPGQVQARFDMLTWMRAALPWFLFVMVANYLLIVRLYGGKRGGKAEGDSFAARLAQQAEPARQPMTRHERLMAAIMAATAVLWVSELVHGIPAYLVAVVALAACGACGIIDRSAFRAGIIWESLLFTGIVLGLAPVFASAGVDE